VGELPRRAKKRRRDGPTVIAWRIWRRCRSRELHDFIESCSSAQVSVWYDVRLARLPNHKHLKGAAQFGRALFRDERGHARYRRGARLVFGKLIVDEN
jgi:hypothetical protein